MTLHHVYTSAEKDIEKVLLRLSKKTQEKIIDNINTICSSDIHYDKYHREYIELEEYDNKILVLKYIYVNEFNRIALTNFYVPDGELTKGIR